jgi:type IV pilus assembly protein PilQ
MKYTFFKLLICFCLSLYIINANAVSTPMTKNISLNFQNIPVRDLLQLLAEFNNTNMVINDAVQGSITLHLENVPWQQALNTILLIQNLAQRQQGNIIFIAPAALLAQANLAMSATSKLIPLHYAKAADLAALLQNKNDGLLSAQGVVVADTRTNSLWLKDTANNIASIQQFVKDFDTPMQQVLITARIVNVDEDHVRDLGLRFSTVQGQSPISMDNLTMNMPSNQQRVDQFTVAIARLGANTLLDLELSALESEGHGKIISNPRLITINRQAAYIESGQEIPYQEKTSSGATNIAFKKAVLSLKITPDITPQNKISLTLTVNQDKVSALQVNGVPAISTQQVQTQVLMDDNETIVLGGIYEQSDHQVVERIPVLGSVPLLGALFRHTQTKTNRRELLIFVTPKIIQQKNNTITT